MNVISSYLQRALALLVFALGVSFANLAAAQNIPGIDPNIEATLLAEGPAKPGETVMLAIRFEPISPEWHGYWENPGDAGYGMQLEWDLPGGWTAGEPLYPVPEQLLISGLMNHIYEGSYAVLVPLTVPTDAAQGVQQIGVAAQWLACTDEICVPEQGELSLALTVGGDAPLDVRFVDWRSAIPPMIDSTGTFEVSSSSLRIGIPVPAALALDNAHVFVANKELGNNRQPRYSAAQRLYRDGDLLVAEIPVDELIIPDGVEVETALVPDRLTGILAFGDNEGVRFSAKEGGVSTDGELIQGNEPQDVALLPLLLAALAGGLILNIMPCVFPILSLKALSLARAGSSEQAARRDGIAYAAGVILACVALGGIMLALRAAGEQVGWAFQLQEPAVVVVLLVLAVAITANFAGIFELPSISFTQGGKPASAFATGLLAAVAATPCSGPFMAAAIGAALLLPAEQALLLFAVLGLGLALPFLLVGFVPAIRNRLPKPGPWMERFRKAMAIPMGLTALALIWLVSRIGGQGFALMTMVLIAGLLIAFAVVGRLQKHGKMAWPAFGLIAAPFVLFAAFALPASYSAAQSNAAASILEPEEYSAAALADARASGQPVFLWFTADWCVTCKVNESVAIEREATRAAFEQAGVIAMRGDWTRRDAEITAYLTQQGAAGVPLYIWYAPGAEAEQLPQVLTPDSLITVAQRP